MESSVSARPGTRWSSAARAVCRWIWRSTVAVAYGLGVAGCRLAGIPMEGELVAAPSQEPVTQPCAEEGIRPLSGPPPGHPERLVPPDLTLSPAEMELWCQLGGVIRWPI
ncbi:MAG: hypothetical protein HOV83_31405 [Catenulispora sp.]|nr:hypothetical protein [Catenulispora sp.]